MRITLLVVGKTTDPHFAAGIEEYARRIRHYLPFDMEVVPELRNTKSLSEEQQKEKEADLLLKAFQPGDHIVGGVSFFFINVQYPVNHRLSSCHLSSGFPL